MLRIFSLDDKRVIFALNVGDPKGRTFELYAVNIDGTGLERITYGDTFASFAMFSMDGKKFVFCSNRFGSVPHETNVFICDWVN